MSPLHLLELISTKSSRYVKIQNHCSSSRRFVYLVFLKGKAENFTLKDFGINEIGIVTFAKDNVYAMGNILKVDSVRYI